jgi:predicted nucleic acid-binding protein
MINFLLDTGILLGHFKDSKYAKQADEKLGFTSHENIPFISIINYAETLNLALRNNWGRAKLDKLEEFLKAIPIIYINNLSIAGKYIEINQFCEGRHEKNPLGFNAIKPSQNDKWIAATASLLNATLITTDKDFLPLDGIFLKVEYFDPNNA